MDATAKKLLKLLDSDDLELRVSAAQVFSELGISSKPVIKALGNCLREPYEPIQLAALKGLARLGPTFRESVLMHAISRLVFHAHSPNIQASWVKLGAVGLQHCLRAGVNDIGGTLMNETITRSAGAIHGQEMPPETLESLIRDAGRVPRQRTTLYDPPPQERRVAAIDRPALKPTVITLARGYENDPKNKRNLLHPDLGSELP